MKKEKKFMEINVSEYKDWRIAAVEGEFVVKHLVKMRNILEEIEKAGCVKIAFDLEKMTYIDSSAITLLLNYHKKIQVKNGKLVIFGASEDARSIFSIVSLDDFITIYKSRLDFEKAAG